MKRMLESAQVHIVLEEYRYEDKFLFKVIGGHTEGSSVIYFEEDNKQYVIATDISKYCKNHIIRISI
ncbi:MAG TPA: hypothetical protein VN258_18875 [Mobilitalea sp.]|nr:hypothetical protein [Mobilitalea sp.]